MPIDPRKLKPTELVRLLNSTPLGEVISERQLHRHRSRAGFRIGDGRTVDLLRYVAWLVIARHRPKPEPDGLTGYDAHKERAAQRNREMALLGRDIATGEWVHPPRNPEQHARAERDFRFFCEAYFPQTFHLPWSPDHLKVIAKIEQAVLGGGLFAMAMPRGSGKTSLCEVACLWALVCGHREFVALVGSDEEHAASMLDSIKVELETNDLLEDDFSDVVGPVRALEGIHQRAAGQIYRGKQTHIGWTAREIVLPTLPPLEWLAPDEGKPLHLFFQTLEPNGERILLVVVFDVLPGVNTPALLPLSRTTVVEVLNWMHQHRLGVTFYISLHNYVACKCAFPVYGRPRREQVETMFNLILGAVNQSQAALHAALQGASLEQALRLVADFPEPNCEDDGDAGA